MNQNNQMNDVRDQLKLFQEKMPFVDGAIIDFIGISSNTFYKWFHGYPNNRVESKIKDFLADDGKKLLETTEKLKTSRKDRIALHMERAAILQKTIPHKTINRFYKSENTPDLRNQRVPSLAINN